MTSIQLTGKKKKKSNYSKYDPLFNELKTYGDYIVEIKIPASEYDQEIIVMDSIPPSVIVQLSPRSRALYKQLVTGGASSPWRHLPSCPWIFY